MIENPKGIDYPIQELQQLFIDELWTVANCDYFHRVFRNTRDGKLIPEVFIGGNSYNEVKFNDRKDVISWFDVSDETNSYDGGQVSQNVGVFFAVNVKKLYPTLTHRAVEEAHGDVLNLLRGYDISGIVTGERAYGDYDISNLKNYNMQPWHVFRINIVLNYGINC